MAVSIRLSRIGKKHAPFFRIVAVDERQKRDGECIEILGTYDGLKKEIIQFHEERINDWISKGAIPSATVTRIQRLYKSRAKAALKAAAPAPKKSPKTEDKVAAQ